MGEDSKPADVRRGLFVELYARNHTRLHAYILALLGNRQEAEDVLQRTSLILWQKFDQFEPGSDFLAWTTTIAFYETRAFLRLSAQSRLRFHDALLETLAEGRRADVAGLDKRLGALDQCLSQLDNSEQDLVRQAYGGELSIKRIAAGMGKAPQTLYNRLNQLRRGLVECVERRLAEAGGE